MSKGREKPNSIDPDVAKRWFGEIKKIHDDLEAQKIENMNECKRIRERRTRILESAEAAGIPAKTLKAKEKEWLEQRRIAEARARIAANIPDEPDDRALFEQLKAALGEFGDTPLGAAAVNSAKPKGEGDDEEGDLRPPFLQQADADRAAAEQNAKAIKGGIKGMPGARGKGH